MTDPKLCWVCDEPGQPGIGSQMTCPECDVTWMPWAKPPPGAQPLPMIVGVP